MTTARPGLRLLLPDHHRRLDAKCLAFLECAYNDHTRALVLQWRELEPELREHLAQEEAVILPGYALFAPEAAARTLAEHSRIRELLDRLGGDIERYEVRSVDLRELAELLRTHAAGEDACMYSWAQQHLAHPSERSLFARVCGWFGVRSEAAILSGAAETA